MILTVYFCLVITHVWGATVVFDLGGVLIDTDTTKSFMHIGPLKFLAYAAINKNPRKCREVLYQHLCTLMPHNEDEIPVYDEEHQRIPQIMCNWLKGTLTSEEALNKVIVNLEKLCSHRVEHTIFHAIAHLIFCPETFIKTRAFNHEGLEFVRQCKNEGHRVYILSNWDSHSFDLLGKLYPEFINLFDGAVVSGKVGLLKPDPKMYQHLLREYAIDIEQCVYIDDQKENIQTAEKLGMTGIICPKKRKGLSSTPDFEEVRRTFNFWNQKKK